MFLILLINILSSLSVCFYYTKTKPIIMMVPPRSSYFCELNMCYCPAMEPKHKSYAMDCWCNFIARGLNLLELHSFFCSEEKIIAELNTLRWTTLFIKDLLVVPCLPNYPHMLCHKFFWVYPNCRLFPIYFEHFEHLRSIHGLQHEKRSFLCKDLMVR